MQTVGNIIINLSIAKADLVNKHKQTHFSRYYLTTDGACGFRDCTPWAVFLQIM